MATNQLPTCSSATSPPDDRSRLLAVIVMLLVAVTSVTFTDELRVRDPGSFVRALLRGPHATQEHRDGAGREPSDATREPGGSDVDRSMVGGERTR